MTEFHDALDIAVAESRRMVALDGQAWEARWGAKDDEAADILAADTATAVRRTGDAMARVILAWCREQEGREMADEQRAKVAAMRARAEAELEGPR